MKQRVDKQLLIFFFIALCIFLIRSTPPMYFINSIIQRGADPLLSYLYKNKALSNDQKSEANTLKEENRKLIQQLAQMNTLKKDNEALRSQFNNSPISTQKLLPAHIVGFSGSVDNPTVVVINRGVIDNIQSGMAVIFENNLVGVISTVGQSFSQVRLIGNKDFTTVTKNITRQAEGILQGEEDFMLLSQVAITDQIEKGDIIVTKGSLNEKGVGIPEGLVIGKVTSVNKQENKPIQSAKLDSLISFRNLYDVFVQFP